MLVLVDGVGDVSIPSLGDVTPLQAARTPFMDAIAGWYVSVPLCAGCDAMLRTFGVFGAWAGGPWSDPIVGVPDDIRATHCPGP